MIAFGWPINNLDFTPTNKLEGVDTVIVPTLIERAIIEGSGGPENMAMTRAGLRFVSYLLSLWWQEKESLPNLKNAEAIKTLAKFFICRTGSLKEALSLMYRVMYSTE